MQTRNALQRLTPVLAWALLTGLAVGLRILIFEKFITEDLTKHIFLWYEHLALKGFSGLAEPFSNYSPPYTYLLLISTWLPIGRVFAIKFISLIFDVVLAAAAYRVARSHYTENAIPWIAFFAILYAPVVFLNSAHWGQCDSIYTAWLLLSLDAILRQQPKRAMLFFSLALVFKAQALFFAPLVLILLLRRQIPWRALIIPPLVYLMAILPAWIAGRPLGDLLTIYLRQADYYGSITMNAATPYLLLTRLPQDAVTLIGLGVAGLTALTVAGISWRNRRAFDRRMILLAAALVVMLVPFVLPKMHERYFYPGTVFLFVLAMEERKFIPLAFAAQVSSLITYLPFMLGKFVIDLEWALLINAGILACLLAAFARALRQPRQE